MRQVFLKDSGWEHSSEKILPDFHMAKEKCLPKGYGVNVLSKKECIFRRAFQHRWGHGSYKAGVYEVQEHSHCRIQDEILNLKILQILRVMISY